MTFEETDGTADQLESVLQYILKYGSFKSKRHAMDVLVQIQKDVMLERIGGDCDEKKLTCSPSAPQTGTQTTGAKKAA